ncbi:hypothetical protein FF38_12535 [Lucilia cuprina]|uniref:Uncharacterized protein n=1 Tax=Lucilia cuprina TaxID=7375 RepID=A0A0L0BMY7_LUCCU|nr:hypothetical protein FF38_12535 [Lucilia cuprina]
MLFSFHSKALSFGKNSATSPKLSRNIDLTVHRFFNRSSCESGLKSQSLLTKKLQSTDQPAHSPVSNWPPVVPDYVYLWFHLMSNHSIEFPWNELLSTAYITGRLEVLVAPLLHGIVITPRWGFYYDFKRNHCVGAEDDGNADNNGDVTEDKDDAVDVFICRLL